MSQTPDGSIKGKVSIHIIVISGSKSVLSGYLLLVSDWKL